MGLLSFLCFAALACVGRSAARSSEASPPPATSCGAWQKGVSLKAHDLSYSPTDSAAACCELCGRTVGASRCTGW